LSLENQVRNNRNDQHFFIKLLAAAPLFATIGSRKLIATTVATATGRSSTADGSRLSRMQLISMTFQPGEDLIVGNRLRQVLEAARKKAA
jgi:hypothetical protein